MSIRIQTDQLAGTQASETSRANQVSTATGSSTKKSSGLSSGGADQIEISSLSEGIAAANSAQETQQAGRVRQLAALYASGHYQVDSSKVSHAMVTQAIGGTGGGGIE